MFQNEDFKPVHLNIPVKMLKQVDAVAAALSQTRSDVIRRAIQTHLQLGARHEVAHARMSEAEVKQHYDNWARIVASA